MGNISCDLSDSWRNVYRGYLMGLKDSERQRLDAPILTPEELLPGIASRLEILSMSVRVACELTILESRTLEFPTCKMGIFSRIRKRFFRSKALYGKILHAVLK